MLTDARDRVARGQSECMRPDSMHQKTVRVSEAERDQRAPPSRARRPFDAPLRALGAVVSESRRWKRPTQGGD